MSLLQSVLVRQSMGYVQMNKKIILLILCTGCAKESPTQPKIIQTVNIPTPEKIIESNPKEKPRPDESLILSSYTTVFVHIGKHENRARNILLAAFKLDGITLEPGEIFSFNNIIGERTEDAGFTQATILFLGTKQKGMGGGICQVSSTLYAAAMLGGIKVIERVAHSRPSDYIPKGMDSTVSFPDLDLKFKNNYSVPIVIRTNKSEPGKLTISLVGISPDFSVKHYFQGLKPEPFTQRVIISKYHRGLPKQKQKGVDGEPGFMYWTYEYTDGSKRKIRVPSSYKPIDEVWYKNPNVDASVPPLVIDGGEHNEG